MNTAKILRAMAERLLTVPDKTFNMNNWMRETPCGTVCCVIGHCWDLIPGLEMAPLEDIPDSYVPIYKTEQGQTSAYYAIAHSLNISIDTTIRLFDPSSYASPNRHVVRERLLDYANGLCA